MTRKLALFTIIPSMLWFLTINSGYSQCDHEAEKVAPLYFSYTYNRPHCIEQTMLLEYWMICDGEFGKSADNCLDLEDWMLNGALDLFYDQKDLENWMLGDMLGTELRNEEIAEWMFGFEPIVEAALYKGQFSTGIEGWMLDSNSMAQQFIEDAFMSIKDWMLNNSYNEHESRIDLEDWMTDGLSMN